MLERNSDEYLSKPNALVLIHCPQWIGIFGVGGRGGGGKNEWRWVRVDQNARMCQLWLGWDNKGKIQSTLYGTIRT